MKYDKYSIDSSSSFSKFEFHSEGPKGRVKKQVIFKAFNEAPNVFNLGFGDVDLNGEVNDTIVTNNNDSQKVLATVALTVYKFFEKHPDCFIYATGSTKERTRLYRMGISTNLDDILIDFDVYGYINDAWRIFEKGVNYEAFLIKRKK